MEDAEKFIERENIHRVHVEEIYSYIRNNLEQVPTYLAQAPAEPVPIEPVKPKHAAEEYKAKHIPMVFILYLLFLRPFQPSSTR